MSRKYFCAHCDLEFAPEEAQQKPRCPQCMRRGGVEPVPDAPEAPSGIARRGWVALVVALIAGLAGYAIFRSQTTKLEDTPPLRPLEPAELAAYLERDQVRAGAQASLFALSGDARGWPESPEEVARRIHAESSPWSLEQVLPRELMSAEETLAKITTSEARLKLYPLEAATAMVALLRERGLRAMVAEVWELGSEQTPTDPSGMLGYFVAAVTEPGGEGSTTYYDPWGGRSEVSTSSVRVLRDTEVIGAALGNEAVRVFTTSGDSAKALPMVETALRLDPVSPSLRVTHAAVLSESGGLPQALQEIDAAIQLRPDGPRKLGKVQVIFAQAAMLQANGEAAAAESGFLEANRIILEVVDEWPRYGRAHLALATVHLAFGDRDRALIELQAAEKLSPESPVLWAVWGQYDLEGGDTAAASAKMSRAVRMDPDNWQMRVQAVSIFHGAGDVDEARRQADAALELVSAERRPKLRSYLDDILVPSEPQLQAPPAGSDPALMLGDPSKLRLRDPGEELQLDLDQ